MYYYSNHYIRINDTNRITHGFSDAFKQPEEDDICINEQGGYQFRLFQNGEENPALVNENGTPLYCWEGKTVRSASIEEIAAWEMEHKTNPIQQIYDLKQQLTATDYQIIKCSECQLAGQPIPYDVETLHTERQALRDQINKLEAMPYRTLAK